MQGLFPAGFDDRSVKIGQNIHGDMFKNNFESENGEEYEDYSDYYISGDEELDDVDSQEDY